MTAGIAPFALIAVLAILAIATGAVTLSGMSPPAASIGDILCTTQPLYGWVTCQQVAEQPVTETLTASGTYKAKLCPETADISDKGCVVLADTNNFQTLYIGSGCSEVSALFGVKYWDCSAKRKAFANAEAKRGEYIFMQGVGTSIQSGSVTYQVYKKELRDCGLAACSNSGTPVPGASGCTWKPSGSSLLSFFGIAVDTVPEGSSYKYQTGSISSCTSECTQNTQCTAPIDAQTKGTVLYDGRQTNWYAYGTQGYYIGCKQAVKCVQTDVSGGCVNSTSVGYCGTLGTFSTGQCSQNSDCGDTTRFACRFDPLLLQGACVDKVAAGIQGCSFDFQCSQTGTVCNAGQKGASKCVSGACQVISIPVQCCSTAECGAGQFCNSYNLCENAPQQQAAAGTVLPSATAQPNIISAIIGGILLGAVLLGLIIVGGFFIPFMRAYSNKLMNMKNFMIALIVIGGIFALLFTGAALNAAASIM